MTDPPRKSGRPRRSSITTAEPTPDAILTAASKLFKERGFADTSFEDIGQQIGLRPSSVLYYYPSKLSILIAIANHALERPLATLRRTLDDVVARPPAKLYFMTNFHVVNALTAPYETTVVVDEAWRLPRDQADAWYAGSSAYDQGFISIIESGVSTQTLDVDSAFLSAMAVIGMCNWTVRWYREGTVTPQDIGRHFAKLYLRGVLPGHIPMETVIAEANELRAKVLDADPSENELKSMH